MLCGVLLTWPMTKRWLLNWGSTFAEREQRWPGDLSASSSENCTRAIAIAAPASAVWPWITQIGLGRAGFYSYEILERLVGIPVKNVESIEPSIGPLAVGEEFRLHPSAPAVPIALIEFEEFICFGDCSDSRSEIKTSPRRSWSIYLDSTGPSTSRLLLRGCIERARGRSWLQRSGDALEQAIDFVMEQRMLRTVKRLAELGYRDDS